MTSVSYMALCACYALMRLVAVGGDRNDFISLMACLFRAVEHSRFEWNAAVVLEKNRCATQDKLDALLEQ